MTHMRDAHLHMPRTLRRVADDERGVTAIITAIALTVLLGFCGLAIDVVMWEVNQRAMQGAADQAALAAGTAYRSAGETGPMGDSATAQNAAFATALQNGFGTSAISVEAYNNGSSCTNDGCIQVTLTEPQKRYFTAIFMKSGITTTASAVGTCSGCGAGAFSVSSNGGVACVMALDASGKGVITVSGTPTMSLNECNLYNNSPNTNATILNGKGLIEGCSPTNPCGSQAFLAQPNDPSGSIDVPVVNDAAPAKDPYAGLSPPSVGSPCTTFKSLASLTNIPSGTYCGTIGNSTGSTSISFATGATIVVSGGLSTKGNVTVSGTNVTLYVTSDGSSSEQSSINATTTLNISAPTTGAYAGIAAWFEGASPVSWAGTNSSSFSGAIYAPSADVSYSGTPASASTCTRLVAASISLTGTANATFDNSGCPTVAGPVQASSGVSGTTTYTGSPVLVQ